MCVYKGNLECTVRFVGKESTCSVLVSLQRVFDSVPCRGTGIEGSLGMVVGAKRNRMTGYKICCHNLSVGSK